MALSNAQWFANPGEDYEIDQSCRFDSDTPAYLARTFGTPTSDKIWTFSFWAKLCKTDSGGYSIFIGAGDFNGNYNALSMSGAIPDIKWEDYQSSAWKTQLRSNATYKDPAAWYHIVYSYDSTPSTPSASSIKIFVNGSQVTSFSTATYPSQNTASVINTAVANWIGGIPTNGATYYFDGYMAEVVFVDGTALDAGSFGETSSTTGQWIPKAISGLTFGNNGFHLDFADSSALGNDVSGNDNDFTSSGLAAADQTSDSPTNNVSTLNPNGMTASMVLSDGNLVATPGSTNYRWVGSTISIPPTGKWVFEAARTAGSTGAYIGIGDAVAASGVDVGTGEWYCVNIDTGNIEKRSGGSSTTVQSGSGDLGSSVIRVEYNADDDEIQFFDDGSSMYSAATAGLSPQNDDLFFLLGPYATYSNAITATFNEDNFAGTPTTDFKGLSTSNFSEPAFPDASKAFEAVIYTGSGSEKAITSLGFSPDLVWIKNRDEADGHNIVDSVRGATKEINAHTHATENTVAEGLKSFDSAGFTLGTDIEYNTSTEKYVSWNWLESVTAGFDIVGWTGDGETSKTLSHSLGVVPDAIFVKNRDGANDWRVFNSRMASDPETDHLVLATNLAFADAGYADSSWQDTMPTSSVFYVGDSGSVNTDGESYVAYVWADVDGFSRYGAYIGNGSTAGPFCWTGMKPATILIKRIDSSGQWFMHDNKRSTYNPVAARLEPAVTDDEATNIDAVDFVSNGFRLITTDTDWNASGGRYAFFAWAEAPFKYATAR